MADRLNNEASYVGLLAVLLGGDKFMGNYVRGVAYITIDDTNLAL
jgi:hypothetical protein